VHGVIPKRPHSYGLETHSSDTGGCGFEDVSGGSTSGDVGGQPERVPELRWPAPQAPADIPNCAEVGLPRDHYLSVHQAGSQIYAARLNVELIDFSNLGLRCVRPEPDGLRS